MAGEYTLIPDFELVKGNSSDLYLIGIKNMIKISDDWVGEYAVRDIQNALVLSGDLVKNYNIENEPNEKYFIYQMSPIDSSSLIENQKYTLYIRVSNQTLGVSREIVQSKIKILPSGI